MRDWMGDHLLSETVRVIKGEGVRAWEVRQ